MTKIDTQRALPTRLTVEEGMTLQEVKEKGNKAQMEARILFDSDGNGRYNETEAKMFNNARISCQKDNNGITEIRVYNKQNNQLVTTIKLDKEILDLYDKLNAKQGANEELISLTKTFGGDKKQFEKFQKELGLLERQFQEKINFSDIFRNLYY